MRNCRSHTATKTLTDPFDGQPFIPNRAFELMAKSGGAIRPGEIALLLNQY